EGTIQAARTLRGSVNKPNVMIKIPATQAGIPAISQMIREGCCVNVTLIFSLERYHEVIEAYLAGLEQRLADGHSIDNVHSVASFFISRVDSELDARLTVTSSDSASDLIGRGAINQAVLAYQLFHDSFSGERWKTLRARGAQFQRPLWASTSTKNPTYPDTLYVDSLIGPHTVNTLPEPTLEAFCDHGTVARTIDGDVANARQQWDQLAHLGIDVRDVAEKLEREGVASFIQSFDDLISSLEDKAQS
ncbi:MAG: transaldolase, partial [Actinomycetota bacterium]